MATYNTGNQVPSAHPFDLYDNAQGIDEAATSTAKTYLDRLGKERKTLAGMEADAATGTYTKRTFPELQFITPPADTSPAGRVTEGPDAGYYVYENGAWEETDDPFDTDTLTANRGKPFPLRLATRTGVTSAESTSFSNLLLSVKIENVDPGKFIGIKYQKNNAAASGSYPYGWTITEHDQSNYTTTDAGAVTIHAHTDPAPIIDRAGGIQKITLYPAQRSEMRIEIVVDAAQLPAEGTPIDSNSSNTRPAWSWIVDESCYSLRPITVDADQLSINSWKLFPFVSRAHANVPAVTNPSSTVKSWLFPIQDFRVQNADPLYLYLVSAHYASGNATYPCRWIIQKQLREGFETQVPDPVNNVRIINYTDPMPLYAPNTGRQSIVLSKEGFDERFYVTIDTNLMPSTGQYLATTSAQDGFTFIIHPAKYTLPERSTTPSVAWHYDGVKWNYDATTNSVSLVWRSGQELRKQVFAPRGINAIPDITSVSRAPLGDPDTASWVEIRAGGDSATPPICNFAVANGDGTTDPLYTGGNHGTSNAAGDPTGRNTSFVFMPDGVPVTATSAGVARDVYFVSTNRVFGANTISLSRETMEQKGAYKFADGAFLTRIKWTALEDVRLVTDNGPQAITTGFDTATGTLMYYGKDNARAAFTSVTDSGLKPDYPDVFAVSFKDPVNGELIVWMDRSFGVGDGRYVQDSRPLVRGGGSSNTKFYHAAVSTVVSEVQTRPLLLAGESYEWRGGFITRAAQPSVPGFDAVMVDPEFPEEVLAIRDNGLIA